MMKPLIEYFDYQEYLRDYYEEKKRGNPYISYRYLGSHMQLDPGFLLKIMQGKHHLADKSVQHVCSFFEFTERETKYFEMLVRYNKAKTPSEIKLYFEKLVSLRDSRARPIQESQYLFYQKWYNSAIHALLSMTEFNGGLRDLAFQLDPPITTGQARESLQLLMKLGMVKRDANGIYRPVNEYMTSGEKWHAAAIHEFQKEAIRLSIDSLDRHPKESRDISTVTVALSAKDLPEIRERIRLMRQSILTLENDNKPDTVYQINIQVIPVSKTKRGAL